MNKQDIINKLIEGNKRYVSDKEIVDSNSRLRTQLKDGQNPYAIILSCADSRVVPELIFDSNIGDLFIVRVAGNIANTCSIASIEYAVAHIGCKLIVVLGHESCGAVTAAVKGGDNGYNLNKLCSFISPAIDKANSENISDIVKMNAKINGEALITNSEIISKAVDETKLSVISAYYNLEKGNVEFDI